MGHRAADFGLIWIRLSVILNAYLNSNCLLADSSPTIVSGVTLLSLMAAIHDRCRSAITVCGVFAPLCLNPINPNAPASCVSPLNEPYER